ncbi:MAG: hypothetical protein C0621_00120 [Desulfuromonas sp.]|nr:MAG: hypothetical protein C0621_00120 [Desulfuromonas sp.]
MKLRCPVCHSSNSLEAFTADDAGRELLLLLAGSGPLFRPLVGYLGCFRPATRDLSHDRALRLTRDVLDLGADPRLLVAALIETTEAMRAKRDHGDVRPLKNHNYLRRVLESLPALAPGSAAIQTTSALPAQRPSKAALLDAVLAGWAGDDWLRIEIAHGLQALYALPLTLRPDADAIDRTAALWERELRRSTVKVEAIDRDRVQRAFSGLLSSVEGKFPEPAQLLPHLPARAATNKLAAPANDNDIAKGKAFFADIADRIGSDTESR